MEQILTVEVPEILLDQVQAKEQRLAAVDLPAKVKQEVI